ncbi:glycerol-3-phosphate 1-O-acyltransferase PlsY [Helicobacter suis]|uniref:glycerol-3-phosphate 1-O-acyltransferase PlsY n=1 Tax=Helicobacter suis TaxID=104628 RepID=UPI0001F7A848|nr:glycerol-3-phosphate 1-O-acyltransferase PlsY [Helicobacter suis]EFX43619.1 membrane protein [Helicobacter suis HS1]
MENFLIFITNINVIFYVLSYLIGGIPFGYVIMKVLYNVDITKQGSKGIGATNVMRVLTTIDSSKAKKIGTAVLLLDLLKGVFTVFLAKLAGLNFSAQWMVAILTIIGHCYSPYLNFSGGKGVSTTMGAVVLLIPVESLLGLALWAFVGKVLKISSLASIVGVGSATLLIFFLPKLGLPASINILSQVGTQTPMVLVFCITLYKHWPNLLKLLSGQEKKVL